MADPSVPPPPLSGSTAVCNRRRCVQPLPRGSAHSQTVAPPKRLRRRVVGACASARAYVMAPRARRAPVAWSPRGSSCRASRGGGGRVHTVTSPPLAGLVRETVPAAVCCGRAARGGYKGATPRRWWQRGVARTAGGGRARFVALTVCGCTHSLRRSSPRTLLADRDRRHRANRGVVAAVGGRLCLRCRVETVNVGAEEARGDAHRVCGLAVRVLTRFPLGRVAAAGGRPRP